MNHRLLNVSHVTVSITVTDTIYCATLG